MMYTRSTFVLLCPLLCGLIVGCGGETPVDDPDPADQQVDRRPATDREPLASDERDWPSDADRQRDRDRQRERDVDLPRVGEADDDVDRPVRPEPDAPPASPDAEAMLQSANVVYARLLSTVVTEDGLVDYEQLERRMYRDALESVISAYAQVRLPEDEAARLALLCNAYNANVLHLVLNEREDPDFDNVMGVSGFFDQGDITVAGEPMTLNELEHDRIRPMGDPRVHAALVSGAMSCPPLHDEPYTRMELDEQFDAQSRRWVNDPSRNRVDEGILKLSSIFQWFGQDFEVEPYEGVIGYVKYYAEPGSELAEFLRDHSDPEIEWLEYDWTLNRAVVQRSPEK